jgi:NitT/TauT family transport system permease protein
MTSVRDADPAVDLGRPRGSKTLVRLGKSGGSEVLTWLVVLAGLLGAMQVIDSLMPDYLFPSVPELAEATWIALTAEQSSIVATLTRFVVALGAAVIVGWALGVAMATFPRTLGRLLKPLITIIQAVPALSWILLAVLWLDGVEQRVFAVVFVIALPFYVLAVIDGVRALDSDVFDAVAQFRPRRQQILRILFVPQSLVYVMLTTRNAAAFCLRILVFAELIAATSGIGSQMSAAQSRFEISYIFAWSVVLIAFNVVFVALIDALEWRLLRWRKEAGVR